MQDTIESRAQAQAHAHIRQNAHAPYGKACASCVKSKTRCSPSANLRSGKCERCLRLNRDCQPTQATRKTRTPNKSARESSVALKAAATLEQKIDGLVMMLQGAQAASSTLVATGTPSQILNSMLSNPDAGPGQSQDSVSSMKIRTTDNPSKDYSLPYAPLPATPSSLSGPVSEAPTGHYPIVQRYSASYEYKLETPAELEQCFETYKNSFVPYCPTVIIPPNLSLKEFSEERPFLWLVIRAVCSTSPARQFALGAEVRKTLGREMLIEPTRTLDLFLGLLVFCFWSHFYVGEKPMITTAIHLAMSLAFDLGIMKETPSETRYAMLGRMAKGCSIFTNIGINSIRTLEERRGVIGLWWIASIKSAHFQRDDSMRWSPYLDECLRILEETKEYPTDTLLVYCVRLQLINDRVAQAPWNDSYGGAPSTRLAEFHLNALQSQLETIKQRIPVELQSNTILQLHIYNTMLILHEYSVIDPQNSPNPDSSFSSCRLNNMWAALTAVQSWFNIWFTIPSSSLPHLPMIIWSQLLRCLTVLLCLSTFEDSGFGWNRTLARKELDLTEVIKTLMAKFSAAAAGLDNIDEKGDNIWTRTNKRLQMFGEWWDDKIAAESEKQDSGVSSACAGGGRGMEGGLEPALNCEFWDDTWMRDVLGAPFDFGFEPHM